MGVSAVVITYNEEADIERCLESLRFADEIVVLDSGSTDRTLEIARRYTDKVSHRDFDGFSFQKQAAVDLATQDWVLVVDADEVITPELAAEVEDAIASGTYEAYRIPRLSYFLGKPIRHCGWYPDHQLRLVKKSRAFFPPRLVHETMVVDCKIGTLTNDMHHYSYRDVDDCARKMVFYARETARQRYQDGRRFSLVDLVFHPHVSFVRMYIVRQGYREGLHGLMLGVVTACSSALRHMVMWEICLREERSGSNQSGS